MLSKRRQRGSQKKPSALEKSKIIAKVKNPNKQRLLAENVQLRMQVKLLTRVILELKVKEK